MTDYPRHIEVYFDGAGHITSKDAPGEVSVGWYSPTTQNGEGRVMFQDAELGTNNVAEYLGLITALHWWSQYFHASNYYPRKITFYGDSQLVINQMRGKWQVRMPHLKIVYSIAKLLVDSMLVDKVVFKWVPGKENKIADRLSRGKKLWEALI